MVLDKIIKLSALLLRLDGVENLEELGGTNTDEQDKKILNLLIKCANLTINEIACDYYPLKKKEILSSNGSIDYMLFSEAVLDVYSVKTIDGEKIDFKLYPSFLSCEGYIGEVQVEYAYMPKDCQLGENIAYGSKINSRIIAFGANREYCLVNSMYEDAEYWDKRYKDALLGLSKKGNLKIPKREWY